jgi:hypothetical protein
MALIAARWGFCDVFFWVIDMRSLKTLWLGLSDFGMDDARHKVNERELLIVQDSAIRRRKLYLNNNLVSDPR